MRDLRPDGDDLRDMAEESKKAEHRALPAGEPGKRSSAAEVGVMQKIPCPVDCPARSGECHKNCQTYLAAYQDNIKRYEQKAKDRRIDEILSVGIRERMKQMHRKQRQV